MSGDISPVPELPWWRQWG